MTTTDRELHRRFAALRLADRAVAPEISALLGRPAKWHRSLSLTALVAAAIVALVGSAWLATRHTRANVSGAAVPTEMPSLLTWRSPTAALLRTPGLDLWGRVPTLRSSLLGNSPADSLVVHNPGA